MKNTFYNILISIIIMVWLMSFKFVIQPPDKHSVPKEYKTMKNPLADTPDHLKNGRLLYIKNCANCHGINGKGDGERLKYLKDKTILPANFQLNGFAEKSDGEHFYNIKFGGKDLHNLIGKMDDEQIWETVIYIDLLNKL